jgi:hypothetical protein
MLDDTTSSSTAFVTSLDQTEDEVEVAKGGQTDESQNYWAILNVTSEESNNESSNALEEEPNN